MKKVVIDLYHLPQFNFFKNTILRFSPEEIDIYCVKRGKLLQVIQKELPNYHIKCIGDYKYNKGMISMIFRIIIPRLVRLFKEINTLKCRYILTANYQANFIGKLKGIPNIAFNDDPRRFVFLFLKYSADEVYLPPFGTHYKGVKLFNALKEWAYLSPKYFSPNKSSLQAYQLEPKGYIFVREVSTKTSNYLRQEKDIILSVAKQFPSNWKVVLSLENKEAKNLFPKEWLILEEPVTDIHSLMYYSRAVISSGDSVAREGAMLGVPSLYAGIRDMPANEILIKKGMLLKISPEKIVSVITNIINGDMNFEKQNNFRKSLYIEWDDVTKLILSKVGKSDHNK